MDNQPKNPIQIVDSNLKELVAPTTGDQVRFNQIMKKYQAQDQSFLLDYFQELNNRLLSTMVSVFGNAEPISARDMPAFGLDPSDFRFFCGLVKFLNVDIDLHVASGCCC